jgi:hypothetical protein
MILMESRASRKLAETPIRSRSNVRVADNPPGVLQQPEMPSISAHDPEIGVPKPGTKYAYTGKP